MKRLALCLLFAACGAPPSPGPSGPSPVPVAQKSTPPASTDEEPRPSDDESQNDQDHSTPTPKPTAATCRDHVKNGSETGIDCGGSCTACATGELCASNDDCTGSCVANVCRDGRWSSAAPMPRARQLHAAVTAKDGRIFVFGGSASDYLGDTCISRVDVYRWESDDWTAAEDMPTARCGVTAVLGPDDRIYVIGGQFAYNSGSLDAVGYATYSQGVARVVEAYDPATDTWATAPQLPFGRWNANAAILGDTIYLFGGAVLSVKGTMVETEITNSWKIGDAAWQTSTPLLQSRSNSLAVAHDGSIFALGGTYDANTGERFTPGAGWSTIPGPDHGISSAPGVSKGDKIYVFGGFDAVTQAYSPATKSWEELAMFPTFRRSAAAALGKNGKIYLFGGKPATSYPPGPVTTVEVLDGI